MKHLNSNVWSLKLVLTVQTGKNFPGLDLQTCADPVPVRTAWLLPQQSLAPPPAEPGSCLTHSSCPLFLSVLQLYCVPPKVDTHLLLRYRRYVSVHLCRSVFFPSRDKKQLCRFHSASFPPVLNTRRFPCFPKVPSGTGGVDLLFQSLYFFLFC